MKIMCPLSRLEEVDVLAEAGADEFYFGYLTEEHLKSKFITNRRSSLESNFSDLEDLKKAIRKIKSMGKRGFLTFNEHVYSGKEISEFFLIIDQLIEAGLDGVIFSDPSIMDSACRRFPPIDLIAGVGCNVLNSEAVQFFNKFGAKQVVLPEGLNPEDIKELVEKNPSVKFEVFIFNSGCANIDGLCFYNHETSYNNVVACKIKKELYAHSKKTGKRRLVFTDYCQQGLNKFNRCKACQIMGYQEAGISSLKIAGRDMPTPRKIKVLSFINSARDLIDKCKGQHEIASEILDNYVLYMGENCDSVNCQFRI